jgi:hypothetical protein
MQPPISITLPGGSASQHVYNNALAATHVTVMAPPPPTSHSVIGAANANMQISPCIMSKTPILQTVAGKSKGVVFAPGGTYHVVGCGFGASPGAAVLQGGSGGGNFNFQVVKWSDSAVDVTLPTSITGVGDQASATFILTPNGGSPLQQPNDSFVAQRAQVLIMHISPGWWSSRQGPYGSPSLAVSSLGVENGLVQYATGLNGAFCTYTPQMKDVFDTTRIPLAPGFGIDSVNVTNDTTNIVQDTSDTQYAVSPYPFSVTNVGGGKIQIDYKIQSIYTKAYLAVSGTSDCAGAYEIAVHVIGPKGMTPLTQ